MTENYKCKQGDKCICGGDAPAVRATCIQYIALEPVHLYPNMPSQEYEWLMCTVLPDGTMTLYKHRMSKRAVLVCVQRVPEGGPDRVTTTWLSVHTTDMIKARF